MEISFSEFSKKIISLIKPNKTPYIIGVTGGSGSGKTFIASLIAEKFKATLIKMDDYYIRDPKITNKDSPEAFKLDLLKQNLIDLHKGKTIEKPVYTFRLHQDHQEIVKPTSIIILDGLFALDPLFANQLDLKVFVDAKESIRLTRRLKRDVNERHYTKEDTLSRWSKTVQPGYLKYILPQKKKADLVIENN